MGLTRSARPNRPDGARAEHVILSAVVLGLAAGLTQVLAIEFDRLVLGRLAWAGRDQVWMAPLSTTVFLLLLAFGLVTIAVLARRQTWHRFGLVVVAAIGCFSGLLALVFVHPLAWLVVACGLGSQIARAVDREPVRWRLRLRRTSLALTALCLVAAGATLGARVIAERRAIAALPPAADGAPNILLLILDTVRASSMSLYGYDRPTTPNIDRLASSSAVYDRAYSPSPWTLPSHASMFTGRMPGELSAGWSSPLDGEMPTLAEQLRDRGYATAGFVANAQNASFESGLARGFIRYATHKRSLETLVWSNTLTGIRWVRHSLTNRRLPTNLLDPDQWRRLAVERAWDRKEAPEVVGEFLDWEAELDGQPFMAFLNIYDAHAPYYPPDSYRYRFASNPTDRDGYDGAIAYADSVLGYLFAQLDARGELDHTVVVITSDHGEQFGEHGLKDHGNSLYLPLLEVPLVIRYPPKIAAGTRIAVPVSLRQVGATLLDLAGLDIPGWPGPPLASSSTASPPAVHTEPIILAELQADPDWWPPREDGRPPRAKMRSVIVNQWHYIQDGFGGEELYDINADPDELDDVATDRRLAPIVSMLRTRAADIR